MTSLIELIKAFGSKNKMAAGIILGFILGGLVLGSVQLDGDDLVRLVHGCESVSAE